MDIESTLLIARLLHVAKLSRVYFDSHLATIGIKSGQDDFLMALEESRPLRVGVMAERLGIRSSTVSKMADILARHGFVCRTKSTSDTRLSLIEITLAGQAKQEEVQQIWLAMERDLLGSIQEDRRVELCEALEMGRDVVHERLARRR